MPPVRLRRPSASMIVAVTALAVAISGTAYAASSLPANSVGSKQLKKNAVTTKKIKSKAVTGAKVATDTLTGTNILESSLGTVPNAAKLGGRTASDITRIAVTPTSSDITLTGASTTKDMLTIALTAPGKGFVRVLATGNGIAGGTGCPCTMQGRLRLDAGTDVRVLNTNLAGDAGDLVGGFDRRGIAGVTVFPVTAGAHTFTFSILRQAGDATSTIGVSNLTLEADFVPFDGTGAPPAKIRPQHASPSGGSNG
jgi:hypothetical protein